MDSGLLVAFTKALKVPESVLMQGFLNGIEVFFYNTDTGEYEYNPSKEAKEHYESKSINNSNTMGIEIRKYDGAIGAGSFGIMDETLISTTFLPNGIFNGNTPKNTKHLMAFEVAGDSMSPIIEERNWVIIDMVDGREYNPVDGIYLCNIDSSYQIKRLQFMGTRGVKIISENQNYETLDSNDCSVFEVIGKLFTIIKIGSGLALK